MPRRREDRSDRLGRISPNLYANRRSIVVVVVVERHSSAHPWTWFKGTGRTPELYEADRSVKRVGENSAAYFRPR